MTKNNTRSELDATIDTVLADVAAARDNFNRSNQSAAMAAANVYLVWLDAFAPSARSDMRSWSEREIASIDAGIAQHNDAEKDLKKRVAGFRDNKLPEAVDANEAAELTKLSKLTDAEWEKRRKVKLAPTEDFGSKFLPAVKYALDLQFRSQSSLASRYAKVLEWVEDKFKGAPEDVGQIAAAINDAGGFDTVVSIARDVAPGGDDPKAVEARRITSEYLLEQTKAALKSAPALASFPRSTIKVEGDLFAFVARTSGQNVEVLAPLTLSPQALEAGIAKIESNIVVATNPKTEFVWRVLSMMELVGEGEKTLHRVDGLQSGKMQKSTRELSLLPNEFAAFVAVISARYSEASVVVEARPSSTCGFAKVENDCLLLEGRLSAMAKDISSNAHCRVIDVVDDVASQQWNLENKALVAKGVADATSIFKFGALSTQQQKPLHVSLFHSSAKTSVDLASIDRWYNGQLASFAGTSTPSKKAVKLEFSDGELHSHLDGQGMVWLGDQRDNVGQCSALFRPTDVEAIVAVIRAASPDRCDIDLDVGGLVRFGWEDQYGRYCISLPTTKSTGDLVARRVEQMR